jgi:hypothetical protein
MRVWKATVVAIALVATACSSGSDDAAAESQAGSSNAAPTPLECEVKEYPCSLSDVPIEILERSDTLSDDVVDMFESGSSTSDVDRWLSEQDGMVEIESDDEAVRFRLEGGRGTWILRASSFANRSSPSSATVSSRQVASSASGPLFHVAGPDSKDKRAVVLSPMLWDFAETDDGPAVAAILASTRGYEGRVEFLANESTAVTNVTVGSFKGWDDLQVVHVVTHGARLCKVKPCRAVIAAQLVVGDGPTGEGILTKAQKHLEFTEPGLEIGKAEGSRGLKLQEHLAVVLLTADFFRDQYAGGLDDTLVFFNACKTYGAEATDLADAIRGNSSVYLGWSGSVDVNAAFASSVALYKSLSEDGYPVEVAFDELGDLQFDGYGSQLLFGKRADGDGLRIRDVVELLNPGSGELLSSSSVIPIVGTRGDGEPDSVPYAVQIDGMTTELAPSVTLHVSVDGIAIGPQPITNGEVNERDQWTVRGEIPLGFDVEEDTVVNFRAWVELHSGGESDDVTSAIVTGEEPIMGYVWTMQATRIVSHPGGRERASTAVLTLEFEDGQDVNEPHPKYVVTGGTVSYGDRSSSALGCTYSGGGLTYNVTPAPVSGNDGSSRSALTFDTTVTPVEYFGLIWTTGPEDTVVQDCTALGPDTYSVNTISYGGNVTWLSISETNSLPVADRELIEDTLQPSTGTVNDFTITRTK